MLVDCAVLSEALWDDLLDGDRPVDAADTPGIALVPPAVPGVPAGAGQATGASQFSRGLTIYLADALRSTGRLLAAANLIVHGERGVFVMVNTPYGVEQLRALVRARTPWVCRFAIHGTYSFTETAGSVRLELWQIEDDLKRLDTIETGGSWDELGRAVVDLESRVARAVGEHAGVGTCRASNHAGVDPADLSDYAGRLSDLFALRRQVEGLVPEVAAPDDDGQLAGWYGLALRNPASEACRLGYLSTLRAFRALGVTAYRDHADRAYDLFAGRGPSAARRALDELFAGR